MFVKEVFDLKKAPLTRVIGAFFVAKAITYLIPEKDFTNSVLVKSKGVFISRLIQTENLVPPFLEHNLLYREMSSFTNLWHY
ncbi:hypothetical protein NBRC116493_20600 [Aurantivibrio infirmus]